MIVMKFGGTSIADQEAIHRVAGIVRDRLHLKPIVVNSAIGKTTRKLLETARTAASGNEMQAESMLRNIIAYHTDLMAATLKDAHPELNDRLSGYFKELRKLCDGLTVLQDLTLRSQDKFLSYGELISTSIMEAAFLERGLPAVWMDARQLIITDSRFTQARPDQAETYQRLREQVAPLAEKGQVPIIQGFIGSTHEGATTTLGFEGSDFSAALVGAGTNASDVQIWKDVPGIMTSDPAIYADAKTVKRISFEEAAQLTFFGAKVLHPSSIQPARDKSPVHVYHSKNPNQTGSEITSDAITCTNIIKSIAYKRPMALLKLSAERSLRAYDLHKLVFDLLDRERVIPYAVSSAENNLCIVMDDQSSTERLMEDLKRFSSAEIFKKKAIVTLVGEKIQSTPDFAVQAMAPLKEMAVQMISHGASSIALSLVVDEHKIDEAVGRLHETFFNKLDESVFVID